MLLKELLKFLKIVKAYLKISLLTLSLVCPAFNADFDGDQMAVHIPLSLEAQSEARLLMLAPHNFLSPATGQPIVLPSQDMVLGCYYLTFDNPTKQKGSGHYFSGLNDALSAYEQKKIDLHAYIWVKFHGSVIHSFADSLLKSVYYPDGSILRVFVNRKIKQSKTGELLVQYIRTTLGRIVFNKIVRDSLLN